MRTAAVCSLLLICFTALGRPQLPPAFEVASIKPAHFESEAYFMGYSHRGTCASSRRVQVSGNRVSFSQVTLCMLIQAAYDLQPYQVFNAPAWMLKAEQSNYYDVDARAEGDAKLTPERAREMLRTLLADRFQLKLHRETRELPVYALVIGKNGPRLKVDPEGPCAKTPEAGPILGMMNGSAFVANCKPNASMVALARQLTSLATDRPVVDRTGLTGEFAYELHWTPNDAPPTQLNAYPSLFTAIQEQLGLRLESQKADYEVVVIDKAEKPSPN